MVSDLGETELKDIAEPIRVYSLEVGPAAQNRTLSVDGTEKAAPPRLSMVVLPFANLGGDAEHEYFVDGVTESLTVSYTHLTLPTN